MATDIKNLKGQNTVNFKQGYYTPLYPKNIKQTKKTKFIWRSSWELKVDEMA